MVTAASGMIGGDQQRFSARIARLDFLFFFNPIPYYYGTCRVFFLCMSSPLSNLNSLCWLLFKDRSWVEGKERKNEV